MQKFKNPRPALMVTTACLALACSKLIPEDKEKDAAPGTVSSPSPTKPTATVAHDKDTEPTPKPTTGAPPSGQNPPAGSNPPATEPSFWIVRPGDTGQTVFPSFAGAKRVENPPYTCNDMAYVGGKGLYSMFEAAFCATGAAYGFFYDYVEPPMAGQKVRSVAVVSPWAMGLKAPASLTAPWILVDIVKDTADGGYTSLSINLKGTHDFSKVPASGSSGSSLEYKYYRFPKLDSDGSVPDDGGGETLEEMLTDSAGAGLGGLQVKLTTQGPAGTLEFKLGAKTLVLEPQWKTLEEILPASLFALPGDGTLVQSGVPTVTTPPMGTPESDLECPSMAFAPTIWDLSGTRKFSYCYGVESISSPTKQAVPPAREHVSVRYDLAAKDGLSAYSVGLAVDGCFVFDIQMTCSIVAETERYLSSGTIKSGETFSVRGLTVTIQESAGVLTSIKVRKPGAATDETFSARQFPL